LSRNARDFTAYALVAALDGTAAARVPLTV